MSVLRLARVSNAFAAVANVWFVILWTRAHDPAQEPWLGALRDSNLWLLLGAGALNAAGLYAYGASLNDVIDMSRDRAMRRDRPIPVGQVGPESAAFAVAGALIVAVLGATAFGTIGVQLTLALAFGVLIFNIAGKWVPAVGMPLLASLYGGHMLVPNASLQFMWPVWLVMTHAIIVAGLAHWIARKPPPISGRAIGFAVLGWAVASGVVLWIGAGRAPALPTEPDAAMGDPTLWPAWVPLGAIIAPIVLAALYVAQVIRRVRSMGMGPRTSEKVSRYGAIWLALYGCAWLYGAGKWTEAFILTGLVAFGVIGMTVLRESYNMIEHPLAYRR